MFSANFVGKVIYILIAGQTYVSSQTNREASLYPDGGGGRVG